MTRPPTTVSHTGLSGSSSAGSVDRVVGQAR